MELIEKIIQGGPALLVLLALSVLAVTLLILKVVHLRRLAISNRLECLEIVKLVDKEGASRVLNDRELLGVPYAHVAVEAIEIGEALELSPEEREKSLQLSINRQVKVLEIGMRPISLVAHLSPLLGLLGTVLGMISSFRSLESVGMKADPSVLAGGIWEALLTTAFGLIIAIPMLAAYHYFESRVDRVADELQTLGDQILKMVRLRHLSTSKDKNLSHYALQ